MKVCASGTCQDTESKEKQISDCLPFSRSGLHHSLVALYPKGPIMWMAASTRIADLGHGQHPKVSES